ncbi:J domain-containing protein [Gottfriedia acidiceleris]|uniref:J domain-containing protein n=1 Tax=Gottfriedia acidiceleris TaxID=371036 RepID=UPI002FFEE25A
MGFFVLLIAFFIIKALFFSGGSSSSGSGSLESQLNATQYDCLGHFTNGFFIEDKDVLVEAPVYSYDNPKINVPYFYTYEEGPMILRNSSGNIRIELRKLTDFRIVPVAICINDEWYKVVDRNGKFKEITPDSISHDVLENISVGRTTSLITDLLEELGANENLILETLVFMRDLLVFNILINRKIIVATGHGVVYISNHYLARFAQLYDEVFQSAIKTMNNYNPPYEGANTSNTDNHIEQLLTILELPVHTRDLNIIKHQYKQLARKYHPDLNTGTEEVMKKINVAYEELCELLKAS